MIPEPHASPTTYLLLSAAAFFAGFVDAIAGGGGLVTLPALLAAGLDPRVALATNKGQAVFGAVASFVSFWRRRAIDPTRAPLAFATGFVGALGGAALLLWMRPEPLRPLVIALLVAAAVLVSVPRRVLPDLGLERPLRVFAPLGLALGVYDGFFGPGTGSILIAIHVVVFRDPLTPASANAKVGNLASNVAALAVFAYGGAVLWRIALVMAVANALGALAGSRLALHVGDRLVRVVVLLVVAALVVKLSLALIG